MQQAVIPLATYRFQLHASFPLKEATALLPYLRSLGVSHVYCSPLLQASPGSTHGYDCADHKRLNPEIASEADFEAFAAKLRELEMSVLLDIVPNHAALHPTNPTLMDVLENGRSSIYAQFYDINWGSNRFGLAGKLLLPVLGAHLSCAVAKEEVKLAWNEALRTVVFAYYAWTIPADPVTIARFLLRPTVEPLPPPLLEALRQLAAIPTHSEGDVSKRQSLLPLQKMKLFECVRDNAEARAALLEHLKLPAIDTLSLLSEQAYRLAFWRSAASEINYRRFFDINELIALRMEESEVFDYTHALPREWLQRGIVTGLRVDHPDGLANPKEYFERLQTLAPKDKKTGVYVLAEKILSGEEEWQREWATHGTTGYEYMNVLTGVFVDTSAEATFTQRWQEITGIKQTWTQMAHKCKRLVLKKNFESDLCRTAEQLLAVLACFSPPRDWTVSQVRRALIEYIAALPVYRTYVASDGVASASDAAHIKQAVEIALQRRGVERELVQALADVFLVAPKANGGVAAKDKADIRNRFVTQFQQMTGAVMAKGCEDTAFYRYLRLSALNEVGNDPGVFGTSLEAFHKFHTNRSVHWPAALSSVSTHDTKRGSDSRLRLAALTERSGEWFRMLQDWMALNQGLKSKDGYPQANEEQFLYQTLLCVWEPETSTASAAFVDRVEAYMMKASKEAKVFTSWTEADEAFETALKNFIRGVVVNERFLRSFVPFAQSVHRQARLTSISHTILHITLPGVPDVYQGTEKWDLSLVDPDNRRPPDYASRKELVLSDIKGSLLLAVEADKDGATKLWTLRTMLKIRKHLIDVLAQGSYTPATITGPARERVVAFVRKLGNAEVIVVVGRFLGVPEEPTQWEDTTVKVQPGSCWTEQLSGTHVESTDSGSIHLARLFAAGPWAVLLRAK